jgi:uroporphyrinogen-III synthase
VHDVLLVRALGGDDRDGDELRSRGVPVVEDPYLVVAACDDPGAVDRADHVLRSISDEADWFVVTSQAALRSLAELAGADRLRASIAAGRDRGIRFATVGEVTARAMDDLGAQSVLVPATATAAGLRAELAALPPASVIAPQGSQAMKGLAGGLRESGWAVEEVVVYETSTVQQRPASADRLLAGEFGAVVLRSPTAVRAVASFVAHLPEHTIVVCGGPTTAAEARRVGLGTIAVSSAPTPEAVADAVVAILTNGA